MVPPEAVGGAAERAPGWAARRRPTNALEEEKGENQKKGRICKGKTRVAGVHVRVAWARNCGRTRPPGWESIPKCRKLPEVGL